MKQFAIAINSEKQYNKVKAYAEKWGYEPVPDHKYENVDRYVVIGSYHKIYCYHSGCCILDRSIDIPENWRTEIRENSPLILENIYVRIDTIDRLKEVWDILREIKVRIWPPNFRNTMLHHNGKEFISSPDTESLRLFKTEITPKQLAQMLGVKTDKQRLKELESKSIAGDPSINVKGSSVNIVVDEEVDFEVGKDLKYKTSGKFIHESMVISRKEFKELSSKLRKRIYDLEQYISKSVNPILASYFEYCKPKPSSWYPIIETEGLVIPKIAIRIENEQEFNDLMKIYEVFGWKWISGFDVRKFKYSDCIVEGESIFIFSNNFYLLNSFSEGKFSKKDYTIIPFSQIKGLK